MTKKQEDNQIDLISQCNTNHSNADIYWRQIFGLEKFTNPTNNLNISSLIDYIFNFYQNYIEKTAKIQAFEEFLSLMKKTNADQKDDQETIKAETEKLFNDIIQQGKYFYLEFFGHIALKYILDQRFQKSLLEIDDFTFHLIGECFLLIYCDTSGSFLYYDNEMNFYLTKRDFDDIIDLNIEEANREDRILRANYSKFIVYIENIEWINEKLPCYSYFPYGDLTQIALPYENKINLSSVDKIIIIIEIATALKDLHSNGEFHGSLCPEYIHINSRKDAYLASIYFNPKKIKDCTFLPSQLYYYGPELIEKIKNKYNVEKIFFDDLKENQLCDIYSFGALIHMIFTEKLPQFRFSRRNGTGVFSILKGNYCKFLFSGESNEVFDDYIDEKGNSLIGMKDIIKKCMKRDSGKRYQSFNSLIEEIKELPIYIRNKEEIEFRIENAVSSKDYKCSLADIVECYYKGRKPSLHDVKNFINAFNSHRYIFDTGLKFDEMEGDIIIKILDIIQYNNSEYD
ncbi:hypothetical protein M9Y10_010694 [Tritrichomonas musculus]|uniref:Protein kinase domain-containing protein n=1 Tax=Tritrichomonas musculus TaxID=1915356 RepID=A0ABR2INY8_9EUKA